MRIALRPNQEALIDASSEAFRSSRTVLVAAPTGFGKTYTFAEIVRLARLKGKRIILIAHRIEIVEQISRAMTAFGVPHGWIAAGRPMFDQPVVVAMVQTLAKRLDKVREPDLLVMDEAHHATAGAYTKIAAAWPKAFVLGVTATPARTDGKGLGACFGRLVMGPTMGELIEQGYLSKYRYLAPAQQADLSGIATRAGDYAQDQLAVAMDRAAVTGDAVAHYGKHLAGRPAIAFCASVAHAKHVAEQFTAAGWRAASVDGELDPLVRRDRIAAIGNGGLQVLTSCDIISEGTDIPVVAGAILLRPTKSLIVYLQQVGRVLRPKPDGSAAVILDHVGNVLRHGMPDEPREWSLSGRLARDKPPPVRTCPDCNLAFAPAPQCPGCGHTFPVAKPRKLKAAAAGELGEVDAARVKELQLSETAELMAAAWRMKNYGQALAAFQEVGRVRGYRARWAFHQMMVWRRRHPVKVAA